MASKFFVLALIVLEKISTSYSYPTEECKETDEWPKECAGKYYCWVKTCKYNNLQSTFDKLLSEESLYSIVGKETDDRFSIENDVAGCRNIPNFSAITMIKDKNNFIWYVPQTTNFSVSIRTQECEYPNRPLLAKESGLDSAMLKRTDVRCVEQRMHYKFPVLTKDKRALQSMAPYKGLPLHCSAKIFKGHPTL